MCIYTYEINITKKFKFFEHGLKQEIYLKNSRNVTKKQAGNTMEILSINLLEKIWENECEKKSVFHFFVIQVWGQLTILSFFASQKIL